tara:strand:- start:474 stop:617 length:144 start_codon:yes stop_codon:yes gene_type:complete
MVTTVLEVLGGILIAAGSFLVAPWLGLIVGGSCLILFAVAFDASRSA